MCVCVKHFPHTFWDHPNALNCFPSDRSWQSLGNEHRMTRLASTLREIGNYLDHGYCYIWWIGTFACLQCRQHRFSNCECCRSLFVPCNWLAMKTGCSSLFIQRQPRYAPAHSDPEQDKWYTVVNDWLDGTKYWQQLCNICMIFLKPKLQFVVLWQHYCFDTS